MPKFSGFLFLLCSICASLFAQQRNVGSTVPVFYEKVYIHTDRDSYALGEDIWFKAYVVNAQNNQPVDFSHNLYVELINPKSKITQRRVVRLECGLGNGDFKLADKIAPGTYRMRAYTNWMRNFGDNFIFEKSINIVNAMGSQAAIGSKSNALPGNQTARALVANKDTSGSAVYINFFPEGGSLVNNVRGLVAVKAEDARGRGILAAGDIIATSGRVVAQFTCDSAGMGSFSMVPDASQAYHTEFAVNGAIQSFTLPKVLHKGFVLAASTTPGSIAAEVNCNGFALSDYGGTFVILEARHAGKTYFKQQVLVASRTQLVQIPDEKFPEGLADLLLYDEHDRPLSERLVYVHHDDNVKLSLATDKLTYQPREKVTVKIKLSDSVKTRLSLAAVDAGIVPVPAGSILEYLTLKSEIKGRIEHPERYFDTTNINRFKQLDLLLLTQGWRDFLWKKVWAEPLKITYDIEQWLPITGRVRKMWSDTPLPDMNITMFTPKATKDKMFVTRSDSAGRFSMYGVVMFGTNYGLFTSRTNKARRMGWIMIDSLGQNILPVTPASYKTWTAAPVNEKSHSNLIAREEQKRRFSFTGNNELKEVDIRDNKDALPDKVYQVTKKDYGVDNEYFAYVLPYMVKHVPKSYIGVDPFTGLPALFVNARGFASEEVDIKCSYINDTARVKAFDLSDVIMNDVVSMTVSYPFGMMRAPKIQLVMRPGGLDKIREWNTTWADLKGYDEAREFYKPVHDVADNNVDLRTTIHWEPNIVTDKNGEATVSFYNADPKSKIRIVVEGLTDKGLPVAATMVYAVK